MLLIYSDIPSNRLCYICDALLHDICGVAVSYTQSRDSFIAYHGAKINYSGSSISPGEFRISPAAILFENTISRQELLVQRQKDYTVLYVTADGDWSFDIFAGAFFLLTRYEEYLPFEPDEYGRFPYKESTAFKNDFLQQPLINEWLCDFQRALKLKFPALVFATKTFRFIPSYDIDIAYSYLHKGLLRNTGGLVRSLLKGQLAAIRDRLEVLMRKKEDPFDVYEWLYALHLKYHLQPCYFFLVARSTGEYDKNIDPMQAEMRELIRYHASGYQVGIHPSWQSGDDVNLLHEEVATMQNIVGQKIIDSRQHYIRFQLPVTYQQLLAAGIRREFSMGYGSINGFRASVCSPFFWYDLEKEEKTDLLVHPFCFMDANAYYEQMLTPQQAFAEIKYYHEVIKRVNGTMITIWHNNFFGSDKMFEGWKQVYELFLQEVVYWDV